MKFQRVWHSFLHLNPWPLMSFIALAFTPQCCYDSLQWIKFTSKMSYSFQIMDFIFSPLSHVVSQCSGRSELFSILNSSLANYQTNNLFTAYPAFFLREWPPPWTSDIQAHFSRISTTVTCLNLLTIFKYCIPMANIWKFVSSPRTFLGLSQRACGKQAVDWEPLRKQLSILLH